MGSSRVGSNPTRSILASYCFNFHADDLKSKLTDDRGSSQNSQLGERQTEDLKVPGSMPSSGIMHSWHLPSVLNRIGTKAFSQAVKTER